MASLRRLEAPSSPSQGSTRGLVCLRGAKSGLYNVANPATLRRVRLPLHQRDHRLDADPAIVITFESPGRASSAVADFDHHHVVVAFQVHDWVCAAETFSSRTWEWTFGNDICPPKTVITSSGVGALGRAFWRTTIGRPHLCVTPETGAIDLIPAPHAVDARPCWEIGEMEADFSVACADHDFRELAVLYLVPVLLYCPRSCSKNFTIRDGRLINKTPKSECSCFVELFLNGVFMLE